jgi:hypothetical protein
MNLRIAYAAVLALALSLGLSSRAAAQKPDNPTEPSAQQPAAQPDNDRMASPAAQQPSAVPDRDDMSKPPAQDRNDNDMSQSPDRDRNRDNMAAGQRNDHDITKQEVKTFDDFLDSHPKIARDINEDPSRVNDNDWVSNHPELKDFLESHPKIREELRENPQAFVNHGRRYERSEQH